MNRNLLSIQNIQEKVYSRCMYCGSTSYGSGCIFSSHKLHIHVDDPTRCIYCGLLAYGSGCTFNPFNKMHIHGMDIAQHVNETVNKTINLMYFIEKLSTNIKDTEAYKLKLINENGNIIRAPHDNHEKSLITPLSISYYKIIKNIINEHVVETLQLLSAANSAEETIEEFKQKIEIKEDISDIIIRFKKILNEKYYNISIDIIERAIEELIIETL